MNISGQRGHLSALRKRIVDSYGGQAISVGEINYIDRRLQRYAQTMQLLPTHPGRLLDVGSLVTQVVWLQLADGLAIRTLQSVTIPEPKAH